MADETKQLHVFFFPLPASGHLIPTIDLAKLFAMKGCKSTIITTPYYEPSVSKSIEKTLISGHDISVATIKLPLEEVGLPEICQNLQYVTTSDMVRKFIKAIEMLEDPLERLIKGKNADCLVADMTMPWTTDVAAKCGIPRIVFYGTGFFSLNAAEIIRLYKPYKGVSSESEPFVIPNFPDNITFTRMQLPDSIKEENELTEHYRKIKESEIRSFGVVVNSFYELEPAYADHYRNFLGRKAWHIGPVFLYDNDIQAKAVRGTAGASNDHHHCLKWLEGKDPGSVVYICFGSLVDFGGAQLHEIAMGLEASRHQFVWVVKKDPNVEKGREEWLPEGFEKRMEGRGLIIRGWVPQILILEHEAIGGFVTHCGWNSTLEAVSSGVPMVTWPVFAEQFYNEKLVTQLLRIGIPVGAQRWVRQHGDFINRELVKKAVERIMVSEEAGEMRRRARGYADLAKKAIEEGGSSFNDVNKLLEGLRLHRIGKSTCKISV